MSIAFIGDLMLGRDDNSSHTFNDVYPLGMNIYKRTFAVLNSVDLIIGNLETAITTNKHKVEKIFNFRFDPKYTHLLKLNNNTCYNLANNHILDYNQQGLIDTLRQLDNNGIKHVGAGLNIYEASKPVYFSIQNKGIAIIGISDQPDQSWAATDTKPGLYYLPNVNFNYLTEIRRTVDLLIVTIHWGPNWVTESDMSYYNYYKDLFFSHGVDIIHGHSPHHLLPISQEENKICIYSNGDFLDDYAIDPYYRNDHGMIVKISLNMEITTYPTIIKDETVDLNDEEK